MTKYPPIAPSGWGAGVPRWVAGLAFAATMYGSVWMLWVGMALHSLTSDGVKGVGDGASTTEGVFQWLLGLMLTLGISSWPLPNRRLGFRFHIPFLVVCAAFFVALVEWLPGPIREETGKPIEWSTAQVALLLSGTLLFPCIVIVDLLAWRHPARRTEPGEPRVS